MCERVCVCVAINRFFAQNLIWRNVRAKNLFRCKKISKHTPFFFFFTNSSELSRFGLMIPLSSFFRQQWIFTDFNRCISRIGSRKWRWIRREFAITKIWYHALIIVVNCIQNKILMNSFKTNKTKLRKSLLHLVFSVIAAFFHINIDCRFYFISVDTS